MYAQNGARAYQQVGLESAVLSASPHQLVVMLFDGALSALVRARLFPRTKVKSPKRRSFIEGDQYYR